MTTASPMPVLFVGHGSPMNAIERNRYTEAWRALGASLPRPRAIVVVSAHWYIQATAVTAMARPQTIHDFYGFPDELFAVEYPAPGAPELVEEVADAAHPRWVGADHDSWGLDHGTWSVLTHLFPAADVPVVQLSINALVPLDHHVEMGSSLAPLRHTGVLIVGSGNVVHNLRRLDPSRPDRGFDWAKRFDEAARAVMTGTSPERIPSLVDHQDFTSAVPTPEHFIPLLHVAGAAGAAGQAAEVLVDGYTYGSLSMTAYAVGCPLPTVDVVAPSVAAGIPDPTVVPFEDTNI